MLHYEYDSDLTQMRLTLWKSSDSLLKTSERHPHEHMLARIATKVPESRVSILGRDYLAQIPVKLG